MDGAELLSLLSSGRMLRVADKLRAGMGEMTLWREGRTCRDINYIGREHPRECRGGNKREREQKCSKIQTEQRSSNVRIPKIPKSSSQRKELMEGCNFDKLSFDHSAIQPNIEGYWK